MTMIFVPDRELAGSGAVRLVCPEAMVGDSRQRTSINVPGAAALERKMLSFPVCEICAIRGSEIHELAHDLPYAFVVGAE